MRAIQVVTLSTLLLLSACSSKDDAGDGNHAGSGGSSGSGPGPGGGSGPVNFGGGPVHSGPMFAGAECPTDLGLPDAYALPNLQGAIDGGNARITFDPQGDAVDYRVYALPAKGQVSGTTIQDAVYRCAGNYEVPYPAVEDATKPDSPGIRTRVTTQVVGYQRSEAEATLGYVFTTPAADRVPVYALGDPHLKGDNSACYYMRWPESRVKRYTTSEAERDQLIAERWRDDGIVFYAPKPGTAGTEPVYLGAEQEQDFSVTYYFTAGPEFDKRQASGLAPEEAFSVYSEALDGAEPLMRVFYQQTCGRSHDELAAGLARFNKAYLQGSRPVPELHWSGISEETTLVVEALDALCPFPGIVSPMPREASTQPFGDEIIVYAPFLTPEELRAASPSGEISINGQGADNAAPKAISRACLKVKPEPLPEMDFRYDGAVEEFSAPVNTGYQTWEMESPTFNAQFHTVGTDKWAIGNMFGELWVTYADNAADTNGKFRLTPKQRATFAANEFVHATMEVDAVSSQRRYPQMLIGNAEWPVQNNLPENSTVIVQVFGGVTQALEVQIEFCDHRNWDVNDQCPRYNLYTLKDGASEFIAPAPEINGLIGGDRTVQFDAYVSTQRVYVYTNGKPYGCAELPAGRLLEGPGTVTYGDVLYHSAVDLADWYEYHVERMQVVTSRHFSNLGFSSGVANPGWDETLIPCVPASALQP